MKDSTIIQVNKVNVVPSLLCGTLAPNDHWPHLADETVTSTCYAYAENQMEKDGLIYQIS